MTILKRFYYSACSFLPMSIALKTKGLQLLLPYHHTVSSEFLPHLSNLYSYKNEQQFTKDLDFLLRYYTPISEEDLLKKLNNGIPIKKSFLLTFDDGFREVYDIIAPILERKGVPAVFFINPAFIGNKVLFYRCKISLLIQELNKNEYHSNLDNLFGNALGLTASSATKIVLALKNINQNTAGILDTIAEKIGYSFTEFLQVQKPFLTTKQVRELSDRGFAIGAHSLNHPYYKLLSDEDQLKQTVESCKAVNEMIGSKNCSFSFPHSDQDLSQSLFNSLLQTNIPAFYGIQNQKVEWNNRMLHRFNAERPETNMLQQVKGLSVLSAIREMRGTNSLIRN